MRKKNAKKPQSYSKQISVRKQRLDWLFQHPDFSSGGLKQAQFHRFLQGVDNPRLAVSEGSIRNWHNKSSVGADTSEAIRNALVVFIQSLEWTQRRQVAPPYIQLCVDHLFDDDEEAERPPRLTEWKNKIAPVAPEGTTEAADLPSSQPDDWNPPWPCVDHRPLLQRIATAQELFEEASTGVDPWPLIERAGAIIDICLTKMVKTKLEYDPSFYDQVEAALWNLANHAELLCRKLTKTDTEKRYFDFTKQMQWIGDKHQQLLPGHDSPNVFVGSSQLRHRLKRFAPLVVISFKWEERLSGKR